MPKRSVNEISWTSPIWNISLHLPFPFGKTSTAEVLSVPTCASLTHPPLSSPLKVSPHPPLCHWHLGRPWPSQNSRESPHTDVLKGSAMCCCCLSCQEDKQQQENCTALNIWGLRGLLNGTGKSPRWQTPAEQETESHVLCAWRTNEGLSPTALISCS